MRTGWRISITLHAAAVVLALFAVPYDDDRDRDLTRVSEVSLVTEFPMARRDQAPEVRDEAVATIAAPQIDPDAGPPPEADAAPQETVQEPIEEPSARDSEADLTALTEEVAQPEVALDVAPPDEGAQDMATLVLPGDSGLDSSTEAPRGPMRSTPPAPRQASRISSFEAPAPPRPAEQASEPTPAVTESETETAAVEPEVREETLPEESTTAPSPDPQSGAEDGLALRRSTAPRARPRNFEQELIAAAVERAAAEAVQAAAEPQQQPAEPPRTERVETPSPVQTPQETPRTETAQAAPAAPAPADVPVGPPLTAGERDGLRLAVQECWSVPAGLENASDLRVVVAAELDPNGVIVGPVRLIEPANDSRREIQIAFEAARRALLRCQKGGYDLPREKYQQWRNLEVAFDPRGMLERW